MRHTQEQVLYVNMYSYASIDICKMELKPEQNQLQDFSRRYTSIPILIDCLAIGIHSAELYHGYLNEYLGSSILWPVLLTDIGIGAK